MYYENGIDAILAILRCTFHVNNNNHKVNWLGRLYIELDFSSEEHVVWTIHNQNNGTKKIERKTYRESVLFATTFI